MSDNKFILQLKGQQTPKSVVEIKNDKLVAPFVNVPGSSDTVGSIIQDTDSSVVVAKSAQNWKLNGNSLAPATNLTGDGGDYTGEYAVSGSGAWVNASYVFPNTDDPNNQTAAIFNAHTKWVLRLCGKNLLSDNGDTITFSFIVKIGSTNIMAKTITVRKSANFFCAQFVGDFSESAQTIIKAQQGQALTIQLLCADSSASATIYNGMTVLTALQRRVDGEAVASDTRTFGDIEDELEDIHDDVDDLKDYTDETFVRLDGQSIMTGPLKMRATSTFQCAIAPFWDGVGFYKLNSDDSVTLIASIETPDGFIPWDTNTYNIGSSLKKWKDLYVARVITAVLNNGANINVPTTGGTLGLNDFSNITDSAKNISNWSSSVTNCITEIPQDIKLEINSSGQLVLKAGSKVWFPDDTYVVLDSDSTLSADTYAHDAMLFVRKSDKTLHMQNTNMVSSGATNTMGESATYCVCFNTTDKKLYFTGDGGNTWSDTGYSYPIGIAYKNGSVYTSIKQVFNGFGYIGKTGFALPGLEYLIPNGRNEDGTLKNVKTSLTVSHFGSLVVSSGVAWMSISNTGAVAFDYVSVWRVQDTEPTNPSNYMIWENPKNSTISQYINGVWEPRFRCILGLCSITNSKITELDMHTAFRAVDYNDTEYMAHQAMPSDRYVDLTLPTTGGTITAPADGYITVLKAAGANGQFFAMINNTNGANVNTISTEGLSNLRLLMPVSKGDVITINYTTSGATGAFRFIYANGVK